MNPSLPLRLAALSIIPLLVSSCASVTVKGVKNTGEAEPRSKPKHIYVEPFSVANTVIKEHSMRKNPGRLKFEARDLVSKHLVANLSKHIAPASLVMSGTARHKEGWLVSGTFTRVSEGSRFLRMAFGLGLGGTKMETRVTVRNLPARNRPFLDFETTGGSGASPGAATNPIPFSSLPTALMASKAGVTDDAERTARMITAEIAHYAARRGWIDPAAAPKVKHARK